jgi:eukaryotic-like serine/threonine-protein kinase
MAEDVFGIVGSVQGGAFRVDAPVAEGGFAVVYRAYHGAFRSNVALKCLKIPRAFSEDEQKEFLEKFREEAELLFRLSSAIPSVVRPLHVGTLTQTQGRFVPFIALEWLDGYTLDKLVSTRALEGKPPLDLGVVVKLLTPVADALCRAHKFPTPNGVVAIVHRDLKPENIFIANVHGREIAKVLDFGIAKVKNATTQMVGRQSANESPMSAFTPAYGAPEQWLPKRYGQTGPWTDVWGLALTVVEALCGHAPIDGEHAAMMGSAIDPERRPTPRNEGVDVSPEVEAVFAQALAVDPRDRFHEVAAFWNSLCRAAGLPEVVGDHSPSMAPPATVPVVADVHARTALASKGATAAVPDLVVGPPGGARGPAPGKARPPGAAGAAVASAPAARAAAPAPRAAADPNALFGGNSFDSFDDEAPVPGLQTMPRAGIGLAHDEQGLHARPHAVPFSPAFHQAPARGARALDLGGPIKLLVIAVAMMAGDYAYATFTGEILRLGPARMLWIAGPLAVAGVVLLLVRLLNADD